MSEIVRIPFHGDEVLATLVDGKPHIVLRPAIESIGLDFKAQYDKLQGKSWACMGMSTMQVSGQRREMVTVDVRTFLMLLATVDENRVAEAVKPKLIAYQSEVADALEAYFTQGGAINPNASGDQLVVLSARIEAQARVLKGVEGLVDPRWLESKARVLVAIAMGEQPELPLESRLLTVSDYLAERGIKGDLLRSKSPTFGKWLKKLYTEANGEDPGVSIRFVDGAQRPVACYTEQDRPLFDQVYSVMFD